MEVLIRVMKTGSRIIKKNQNLCWYPVWW